MARPAIRVIDGHVCPEHGPDSLSPDGSPNVRVNGQEASFVSNPFLCRGIMNRIASGASTVTLNGEFAARALDGSDHKGKLVFGSPNVVVGGPTGMGCLGAGKAKCRQAASGRASGAVQQSYGNCMPESLRQIIHQATGVQVKEDELLKYGLSKGYSTNDPGKPSHGGTSPDDAAKILNDYGVPAELVPKTGGPTPDDIKQAVSERKGVVLTMHTSEYWPPELGSGYHAVMVSAVEVDDHGNVTAVYLNDTGLGACGMKVPADKIRSAIHKGGNQPLVVTKGAVW